MIFRAATQADQPALDAMMHASNGYASPEMRAAIESERVPASTGAYVVTIMENPDLCGFHALKRINAEEWELDLFFIANDRQGQGLGAHLFHNAVGEARKLGARSLIVVSNPSAADFYARMGGVPEGVGTPVGKFVWPRPKFRFTL